MKFDLVRLGDPFAPGQYSHSQRTSPFQYTSLSRRPTACGDWPHQFAIDQGSAGLHSQCFPCFCEATIRVTQPNCKALYTNSGRRLNNRRSSVRRKASTCYIVHQSILFLARGNWQCKLSNFSSWVGSPSTGLAINARYMVLKTPWELKRNKPMSVMIQFCGSKNDHLFIFPDNFLVPLELGDL